MPIGYEQLIEKVTAAGLLAPGELSAIATMLAAEGHTGDASEMARLLVRENKLTKYQAAAVYQDKIETLTLGNYIVHDRLGAGGMGQVYRARHRKMDRIVAIKVLSKKLLSSPEAVERFQREVKAAARVTHMNIVTAYDADEADGTHFLVMEYVEGSDLSQLVKQRGPLPVAEEVEYVRHVAAGLAHAHGEGIVHRDIKPSNLLVDKRGTAKILDMGLARIDATGGVAADVESAAGLTQQGSIMGTVDFMAPEQAVDTRKADARADLYSLGCTLHYLLVGRAPFGGETLMQRLLAHRDAPIPSLTAQRAEVPAPIDAIFQRLVAKRADERFQSAGELLDALSKRSPTIIPVPTAPPRVSDPAPSTSSAPPRKVSTMRKKSNAIVSVLGVLGIVVGGLGGLSMAYLLLMFFRGSEGDFLHLFAHPPAPVAQQPFAQPGSVAPSNETASAKTVDTKPTAVESPHVIETRATIEPEPAAVSDDNNSPAAAMQAPMADTLTTDAVSAAVLPASTISASTDTPVTSSLPPTKSSVPDEAAVAKADALVKDIFKDDFASAKTLDAKLALAEKLLQQADANEGDAAGCYVMLTRARDLAIDGVSPAIADCAAQLFAERFDIDRNKNLVDALERMAAKTPLSPSAARDIAIASLPWIAEAVDDDRWELAKRFSDAAIAAARKSKDAGLTKEAFEKSKMLAADNQQWDAAVAARATLATNPEDPAANLALGRYLCFVKELWDEGFVHLAHSDDAVLNALASKSLGVADDAAAQANVGDAWWDAAEKAKAKEKENLRRVAGFWYESAVEGLTGLAKARVEKRLAELDASLGTTASAAAAKPAAPPLRTSAAKLPPNNGLVTTNLFDCSEKSHSLDVNASFDVTKSWTLALECFLPNLDPGLHQIICFTGKGDMAMNLRVWGNNLGALVHNGHKGFEAKKKLSDRHVGMWHTVLVHYDITKRELSMYLDGSPVDRGTVEPAASVDPPLNAFVGGNRGGHERFKGQVRNIWLGNQTQVAPVAASAK